MAEPTGLEPATSGVTVQRELQLHHGSIIGYFVLTLIGCTLAGTPDFILAQKLIRRSKNEHYGCTLAGTPDLIRTKKYLDVARINIMVAGAGLEPATFGL